MTANPQMFKSKPDKHVDAGFDASTTRIHVNSIFICIKCGTNDKHVRYCRVGASHDFRWKDVVPLADVEALREELLDACWCSLCNLRSRECVCDEGHTWLIDKEQFDAAFNKLEGKHGH